MSELEAIRKRLADWPYSGWAVDDCHTLVRMVDELHAKLAEAERAYEEEHATRVQFQEANRDHFARAEAAEARVRELEQKLDAITSGAFL